MRPSFPRLRLLLALLCLPEAAIVLSQTAQAPGTGSGPNCTLLIHVDGLRNSSGKIGTVVFKTADGWPENTSKALRVGPSEIVPGERQGTAVWNGLPSGDYAVAAIHDENSNARLDRNLIGIPKEGFGFANNPHVGWGPPPFQAALVHVACPVTETTIHIQYR